MRYISLFSGIEAASVAWKGLGWEPLAFSEIEPFPCAVLKHHYPNVPNLGDITQVNWRPLRGKADVIVGGSPCQSFSIAGKREGLAGESGLMFEYIRAVREVRPQWFIWENVPGAFSVEHGTAFRQLLSEMDKLGYGLAWRVLDAQFFGVAQRRRRVFLVGSLGTMRSADVLFEPESMSGNTQSSREKREELARAAGFGADSAGFLGGNSPTAGGIGYTDETSPMLKAGASGTNMVPDVIHPVISLQTDHMGQNGKNHSVEVCKTLDVASSTPVVCVADDNANAAIDSDLCGSLKVGGGSAVNS